MTPIVIQQTVIEGESEPAPKEESDAEISTRERLLAGNTVGEVTLAFGNIDRSNAELTAEITRINDIIAETNYWAHFETERATYILVFDDYPRDDDQRVEFLSRMRGAIKGNPEIFVSRHGGNIGDTDFINFIDTHQVPPESILDYRPGST